jgi:flagellar basal-body rod protein FlgB
MSDLMKAMFDRTIPALEKSLDLSWRRNEAITSNVANAETPGYRAVDMNFAGELERAFQAGAPSQLKKTDSKHMDVMSNGKAFVTEDLSGATRPDGNNVDIDVQMGKMVYNQGKYSMGASLIRKKLHMMRTAIRFAAR